MQDQAEVMDDLVAAKALAFSIATDDDAYSRGIRIMASVEFARIVEQQVRVQAMLLRLA